MKALLVILACCSVGWAVDMEVPRIILGVQGGRFVFGQLNEYMRTSYMLDTQSGRLWKLSQKTDSTLILEPIPYADIVAGKVVELPAPKPLASAGK